MGCALVTPAHATLLKTFQFNGNGNWSIDAVGSNSTPVGDLTANVPTGSTVEKAFLYSSTLFNSGDFVPSVGFDGVTLSGSDWTNLGTFTAGNLTAFRTDVTTQVSNKIGSGGPSPFTFTVESEAPNSSIDGEVLSVVYSNPNEKERTIAFLDGGTDPSGDSFSFAFSDPLTASQLNDPTFEAVMSLGIGFGSQGTVQASEVDVNGQRLTSAAGGQDDGANQNGALITAGGEGDSPDIPSDPFAGPNGDPRFDDELYDISSFLSAGDSSIGFNTLNPSNDDNIFFAGLNITAEGEVSDIEDVPVPATFALLGAGLLGLGVVARRRR
jgi:hypothetical protein